MKKLRHVLAQVRKACGLTQQQLSQLLNVSPITVQRVEQHTLGLSEELARKTEEQLDVSSEWLLADDPKIPPLSPRNAYWKKELYEFRQGSRFAVTEKKLSGKPGKFQINLEHTPAGLADKLTAYHKVTINAVTDALLEGAKGSPRQGILVHRFNQALRALQNDFELDSTTMTAYWPKLQEVQEAFNKAAKEYSEHETEQLWRKPSREKRKAKPDSASDAAPPTMPRPLHD